MIHFSDRERMYVFLAPAAVTNSMASIAEAPPPMTMTFLPLASCSVACQLIFSHVSPEHMLPTFAIQLTGVVDVAPELVLALDCSILGLATSANGGNHAIKATVALIVDNPTVLGILVDLFDPRVELSLLLEPVRLPQLLDRLHYLFPVGIALAPLDGGEEAVHDGMDLQSRRVVHFGPDASHGIFPAGFEQRDIEAMTDTVCCRRDSSQAGADDGDTGTAELRGRGWRGGREYEGEEALKQSVEEVDGVVEQVLQEHLRASLLSILAHDDDNDDDDGGAALLPPRCCCGGCCSNDEGIEVREDNLMYTRMGRYHPEEQCLPHLPLPVVRTNGMNGMGMCVYVNLHAACTYLRYMLIVGWTFVLSLCTK